MNEKTETVTFGFWVYILSDCVLFAALFAAFAVLRSATAGGPSGSELFGLPLALSETLILLTSSFTMGLSFLFARAGNARRALAALAVTLVLGLVFLGIELNEFAALAAEGHSWQQSAFLSSYFTLVGTHGLHVALGSLWMIVLMAHVARRGLSEGTMRKLLCLSLFWHFLDIIWICIFTFVYLFGLL